MKILNFGSCNIDFVYSMDHIVKPGETEATDRLEIFPGGKGLNQSIATAKAGAAVFHAGCVGSDGQMLVQILKENGVDTSFLQTVDAKNGHAIIQVSATGENSIFLYPGSNEMIMKEYVNKVLENFEAGDMLLLQNEISNVDYIVETAYQKGMTIILNPSPFNSRIDAIDLAKVSYLILNEVEASAFSGSEDTEECLTYFESRYPNLKVMLTLGKEGSIYMENGRKYSQAAFEVDTVDTTAAGDTFTGYFVAGISSGEAIEKILKTASAAAAIAVSRMGAAPSIPDWEEVLSALKSLKSNHMSSKSRMILKHAEKYIEENIKTASLSEFAEQLGYSIFYTGNLVRKAAGESFTKLVQRKRCKIAAEMLRQTDLSVKEIIQSVGYENESFFRKIFKAQFGRNPLEFKKGDDK